MWSQKQTQNHSLPFAKKKADFQNLPQDIQGPQRVVLWSHT